MLAFGIKSANSTLSLIGLLSFMATFATSSGNVTWCYMAEISSEKGMGIGATVSWILTLLISLFTKDLLDVFKKDPDDNSRKNLQFY